MRIIAPSRSLGIISESVRQTAESRLSAMGFKISYAGRTTERDEFDSSSIESRVADMHEAFADRNVKGILTAIGGFNANQLLGYLDYDLIAKNPKIICGYSDVTVLLLAIYAKTGLVTYYGPHFSTFGMRKGLEYTEEYFRRCLAADDRFSIVPSEEWSDDKWYIDQEARIFEKNEGPFAINIGEAQGKIIGGNICTINLLQGTEFMPDLDGSILLLEEDDMAGSLFENEFDRNLQSILHLPQAAGIKGIAIGRFQKNGMIPRNRLERIIKSKKELRNVPVAYGFDFGHTSPMMTFPIGGTARLAARQEGAELEIINH